MSLSAIAAIQNYYDTLNAAAFPTGSRPPIYFAEVPAVGVTTTQPQAPPYVLLEDDGEQPTAPPGVSFPWAIGNVDAVYVGSFTLKFYDTDLGVADAMWWATMWNGLDPALKGGLAFCTLSMTVPLYSFPYNCIPGRVVRGYAGFQYDNKRVHVVEQTFERKIYLSPQGNS